MLMLLRRPPLENRRKRLRPRAIVALAVAAIYYPYQAGVSGARAEIASGGVQGTVAPSKSSLDERKQSNIVIPATIQAFYVTDLFAKDSGYISQVNNDIGDDVKKGQVLAVISDPELQAAFDKAQAAVHQTEATLEVAKRTLVGNQADLALQKVTLKRQRELFAGKAATGQALDDQVAKESVSGATLETQKAKVKLAEADIDAAKAEVERLGALLQYDKIIAPFDGVVTRRTVNPGDLVQAATGARPAAPLYTVQEIDVVRVFADAPEESAERIRPGLPAEIELYGTTALNIQGVVTRIAKALDAATRTMRIEIDVPNPDGNLLPGTYAQVILSLQVQQTEPKP